MSAAQTHPPAATTATATDQRPDDAQRFLQRLRASLDDGSFSKLQLARPVGADDATLDKLLARRVALRGQDQLQLVWRHQTKDITKNLPLDAALALLGTLLGAPFRHAHLLTRQHDIQLAMDKKGRWALRVGRLAAAPASADNAANADAAVAGAGTADASAAAHNRAKPRALALDTPFLAALGICDAQQRLVPAMARKWRQINKFVEVLGHALDSAGLDAARRADQPLRVLDFGAGKGYLTFAVHHHLLQRGLLPDVSGVELRDDLTALCNSVVATLGLAGLRFITGDVRSHAAPAIDVMIALHACDTATDVALHRGIRGGAAVILCSPCCHKELRPQIKSPPLLQPMLRHGIHMTEQAEMLTDALRALLLQAAGYDTQVFEFISPEHTGKAKMVMAVRRAQPLAAAQAAALRAQAAELMAFYGVRSQYLAALLDADAAGTPAPREPLPRLPAAYAAADAVDDGDAA